MNPRALRLALLILGLGGCTLADNRGDVAVLPEGPLYGSATLGFEVRAAAGSRAAVRIDGHDRGTVQTNAPVSVRLEGLAEGSHTLRVTVFEGPYVAGSVDRTFVVDTTWPTCAITSAAPSAPDGGAFRVTVAYSEPIDPVSVAEHVIFVSRGIALPTAATLSADGLTVAATLGVPLEDYPSVLLRTAVFDLAGNEATTSPACGGAWSAPQSPLIVAAPAEVDDSLTASVALADGWTGPTGPITVGLCRFDPNGVNGGDPSCITTEVPGPGDATIDTSSLLSGIHHLVARIPGHRNTDTLQVTVVRRALTVSLSTSRSATNGPILIHASGSGGFPPVLEVLANGAVIGTVPRQSLSGFFSKEVPWDAAVPDGDYPLSARAAGWQVSVLSAATVTVDRTPPVATPAWPAAIDLTRGAPLAVTLSEPVTGTARFRLDGALLADVAVTAPATEVQRPVITATVRPWTDGVLQYDVSGLLDRAGNPAGPALAETIVPVWLPAAGTGPLEADGDPVVATEAAALWSYAGAPEVLRLAFVDPQGQVRAGRLSGLLPDPLGTTGSGLLVNSSLGGIDEFTAAWTQSGPGAVTVASARVGANGATALAPAVAVAGASPLRTGAHDQPSVSPRLTWTEPDGAGARAVRFKAWDGQILTPQPGLPTTALDAVEECCAGEPFAPARWAILAWIDGAAPVPQLALSTSPADSFGAPGGPWSVLSASANLDAAQPASEPALHHDHVAWIEGGRVRAGRLVVPLGTPTFVRDDPASAAGSHAPRFIDGSTFEDVLLIFVEPGQGGDVIAARRWTAQTGWISLTPVNAGLAGEVRSLAADGDLVTWTDAAGHVFARRLNR